MKTNRVGANIEGVAFDLSFSIRNLRCEYSYIYIYMYIYAYVCISLTIHDKYIHISTFLQGQILPGMNGESHLLCEITTEPADSTDNTNHKI